MEEEIEVGRGGRGGKAGQRGAGEVGVARLPFLLLRLQPITQGHQLIRLGDDALLLGEGWEGYFKLLDHPFGERLPRRPNLDFVDHSLLRWTGQKHRKEPR